MIYLRKNNQAAAGPRLSGKKGRPQEFFVASLPMIGFLLFGVFPFVMSIVMSFMDLHSTNLTEMEFVGLDNYKKLLSDPDLLAPVITTLLYTLALPLRMVLALFLAYQLTKIKWGQKFFSAISFIPNVCSLVAVALAFKLIFKQDGGVLNSILNFFGFKSFGWIADSPWAYLFSTMAMSMWMGLGGSIILYRAALSSVDKSYYEAATLEGATPMQMFWKITWPAVSPVTSYMFTTGLIGSLQVMGEMMVLESEGTLAWWSDAEYLVGDTVSRVIYNMIFVNPRSFGYGMASAAGWLLATVIFIVSQVNLKTQEKWVCYDF